MHVRICVRTFKATGLLLQVAQMSVMKDILVVQRIKEQFLWLLRLEHLTSEGGTNG
jgi:hypothetical protein